MSDGDNVCKLRYTILMNSFKKILLSFLILNSAFLINSQSTSIPGLYSYRLENGLELYVMENDAAPLAYVEIAVRCGAVTQTKETAGLFHLYEHMMFKGNARYANEKETMDAMNALGVGDWNGTTGTDRVNYFFTVPSNLVRNGLEFWSYAVRTPLMDEKELANEKGVVLSEITGNYTNPSRIVNASLYRRLYPEYPYKLDTSGVKEIIQDCTVEKLKQIQADYYVPDNSVVFVGGDVDHEEIYRMVCEIYGDWKKSGRDFSLGAVHSKTPVKQTVKLVYPNPQVASVFTQASFYLRGPDGETDVEDTYGADVWSFLLDNPSGVFAKTLTEDPELSIPDPDYAGGFYSTQRCSGLIGFSCAMMNDDKSPVARADHFYDVITKKCVSQFLDEKSGFCDDMKNVIKRLEDSRVYSLETPEGFMASLSSTWSSVNAEYFINYDSRIAAVTPQQVRSFVRKYISGKQGILVVNVNPSVYEQYKSGFQKAGYIEVKAEEAFWWNAK